MAVIGKTLDFVQVPWIDGKCGAGIEPRCRRHQGVPANCVNNCLDSWWTSRRRFWWASDCRDNGSSWKSCFGKLKNSRMDSPKAALPDWCSVWVRWSRRGRPSVSETLGRCRFHGRSGLVSKNLGPSVNPSELNCEAATQSSKSRINALRSDQTSPREGEAPSEPALALGSDGASPSHNQATRSMRVPQSANGQRAEPATVPFGVRQAGVVFNSRQGSIRLRATVLRGKTRGAATLLVAATRHRLATGDRGPYYQLISMSCPRAGPVMKWFRSMLKNGSTFIPSGPM